VIGQRESEGKAMVTACYFCKGRVVQEKIDVDFRWGRKLKVIEKVPAGVCQQCGEQYFEAAVYKAMEKLVTSRAKPVAHLTVDVMQFKEVA
jgi:YgiT-type zinc finger domain-containing protein